MLRAPARKAAGLRREPIVGEPIDDQFSRIGPARLIIQQQPDRRVSKVELRTVLQSYVVPDKCASDRHIRADKAMLSAGGAQEFRVVNDETVGDPIVREVRDAVNLDVAT